MNGMLTAADLPVLFEADAAVICGSFAGIACAVRLAARGKKVVVLEPRTYLGRELTATLRPWLTLPEGTRPELLPLPVRHILKGQGEAAEGRDVPLHPDSLKRGLEDLLAEHGIDLLYATLPIAVMRASGRAAGLVVANKSGRQAVRCPLVVDATETALSAALCGEDAQAYAGGSTALYRRTLEFTGVALDADTALEVPADIGVAGNRIALRQGYLGKEHRLAEFGFAADSGNRLASDRDREAEARRIGMRLAKHLMNEVPAFRKATFAAASHELLGPFPIDAGSEAERSGRFEPEELASSVPGVYVLGARLIRHGDASLLDPVQAAAAGERLADALLAKQTDTDVPDCETYEAVAGASGLSGGAEDWEIIVPALTGSDGTGRTVCVGAQPIPLLKHADVLVAGGGTSGACASITAAREGMDTLLLELNPGLGGTGTFGGVDSYWFGKRDGYAAQITEDVLAVQRDIRYKGHKWNLEAKMYALLRMANQAGVDPLFNAITFGAVKSGSRVIGAVAATRWGAYAATAHAVIDATGDGDVAAMAGAPFVYGSEKDHTVMWYSLAQFQTPVKLQNNFTSMVDVSNALDYTRAILAGRRRGSGCHDHGIYVATRESRHMIGDVVMRLTDQLLHRRWPDVVNVHFSNHDVKGVSGAEWVNVGLIPPNLEIEIPYRMLLPRGLEGILVVGKAISATHDALPAIRMQSDLENLGAVAALAAAQAVRSRIAPRSIDVKALQRRLVRERLIPEETLARELAPLLYADDELSRLVDSIESEEPLYEYSNMRMNEVYRAAMPFVEICSAGPRIVPYAERAMAEAVGVKRIRLAQALAMLGSSEGVPVLIDAIMAELTGDGLPVRTADIMYVQLPPDHGAMPDVAYLLYSLAQAADPRSVPVWERVAALLRPDEDDFKDTRQGIFYYVDAVCRGAERLGDRRAIAVLERLHAIPLFKDQQSLSGAQPDYFLERRSMLELAIGRALARCGSPAGYDILIRYLDDVRSLLAKNALLELQRLGGRSLGKDARQWRVWLEEAKPYESTYPLTMQLDIEPDSESLLRRIEPR
ncbi:FAD-dependent oxidoreductase [Paenibacillus arenilitoris]|uniref:FAD-dependent oxidoreductase n=1 Tax=Paenibacillus arenilitoris TaxID=2772299 RepID=A0A927CJV1_9BACL|nr:FAD-dependent oxidoreductase [Paenibacillus arenilitoris]MBD2868800.1 FAD-dependent oxidoreductase [Paenibacillus arenilitoris]